VESAGDRTATPPVLPRLAHLARNLARQRYRGCDRHCRFFGAYVRLAGWQARALKDHPADGTPKYFSASGMKKNDLLYGLTKAIKTKGPVVVVEGVTDVWRLHTNGVASFGKTISPTQTKLILRHFHGRPVVILLDADAADAAIKVYEKVAGARLAAGDDSPVIIAMLPGGRKDPGEYTREEAWNVVTKVVKGAG